MEIKNKGAEKGYQRYINSSEVGFSLGILGFGVSELLLWLLDKSNVFYASIEFLREVSLFFAVLSICLMFIVALTAFEIKK